MGIKDKILWVRIRKDVEGTDHDIILDKFAA
jgi:hypothetical protein